MSASSTPSKIPTITEFANVLSDEPGWYAFGIFMNVSNIDLDYIDRNYGREGNMRCLIEMYTTMETRGLSLSWERIVESLKGVKNFGLAEKIRLKYISPYLQSSPKSDADCNTMMKDVSTSQKPTSEKKDLLSQEVSVLGCPYANIVDKLFLGGFFYGVERRISMDQTNMFRLSCWKPAVL